MDSADLERAGVFVETAFTIEQVERAIAAEIAQSLPVGECAFLVDLVRD